MNVLITGGAGFIGSALAIELVSRGDRVTILDNLSPQIHGENGRLSQLFLRLPEKVNFIEGDVRKYQDLEKALCDQEVVVHLAAETGTGQSMYEIDRYVDVNIKATSLLLDIIAKGECGTASVRKVVVASSRSIYGEGKYEINGRAVYPLARNLKDLEGGMFECRDPESGEVAVAKATDEESKIHPSSVYGITKQVQEQLVLTVCKSIGREAVALRYQNVYGPGQSLKNPYTGILSIFSTLLLQGKDIKVFEDGKETRDFVYIDDVVRATMAAIDASGISGAFNVGTGEAIDVLRVAKTLKDCYQAKGDISITGNFRLGDIRHNYADISKAKTSLGFEAKVSFDDGVRNFSSWVATQEVEDSGYDRSIEELKSKGLLK